MRKQVKIALHSVDKFKFKKKLNYARTAHTAAPSK